MATLPELLKMTVDLNGSDLHIAIDTPPQVRVHGELQRMQLPPMVASETKQLVYSVLTDSQKKRFEESNELDFSFGIRGLVLITGPTGSGKSTTLAAMLDKINSERHGHILTIEDPIEYIHQHKNCL